MTESPQLDSACEQRLRKHLAEHDAQFTEIRHEPTFTSRESAKARGEELKIGGKSLLIKAGEDFVLLVLPANRKLSSSRLREALGVKRMRFATRDELVQLTGLVPGCVPPFGEPVLPFPLHLDRSLTANDRVAFNAASLTISFIMPMEDYLRLVNPVQLVDLSKPGED